MKKTKMKDCFGEETRVDYISTNAIDNSLVEALRQEYSVEIFQEFPRPFIRIISPERFLLTGVIGLNNLRVTFRKDCPFEEQEKLEEIFRRNSFN